MTEPAPYAERLVAEARALVGTPWRHLGRGPGGLDCVGLVLLAARRAGLPPEVWAEPPPYSRHATGPAFLAALAARCPGGRIARAELAPGDVATFTEAAYPCHVGIIAEAGARLSLVHAYVPRRRVVEEPLAGELLAALRACFRPPWR